MKCQILFSGKNKKYISLVSAEFAHSMVNVKVYFEITRGYFFLFLHKVICCRYLLESPHLDNSNEYPQLMFLWN